LNIEKENNMKYHIVRESETAPYRVVSDEVLGGSQNLLHYGGSDDFAKAQQERNRLQAVMTIEKLKQTEEKLRIQLIRVQESIAIAVSELEGNICTHSQDTEL
jgi:hypothetical protein